MHVTDAVHRWCYFCAIYVPYNPEFIIRIIIDFTCPVKERRIFSAGLFAGTYPSHPIEVLLGLSSSVNRVTVHD